MLEQASYWYIHLWRRENTSNRIIVCHDFKGYKRHLLGHAIWHEGQLSYKTWNTLLPLFCALYCFLTRTARRAAQPPSNNVQSVVCAMYSITSRTGKIVWRRRLKNTARYLVVAVMKVRLFRDYPRSIQLLWGLYFIPKIFFLLHVLSSTPDHNIPQSVFLFSSLIQFYCFRHITLYIGQK